MKTFVLGIDPGETTGIGLVNPEGKIIGTKEVYKDPLKIAEVIMEVKEKFSPLQVVIEDFVGSGPRSRHGVYTIKLVGWLTNFCKWQKITGTLHNPQRRYCMVSTARNVLKGSAFTFSNHTMDASAHALALWEIL